MHVHSTYVQTKGRQFKPFMVSVLFDGTGFWKQSNGRWLETTSQLPSPLWQLLKLIVPGGDFVPLVNRRFYLTVEFKWKHAYPTEGSIFL